MVNVLKYRNKKIFKIKLTIVITKKPIWNRAAFIVMNVLHVSILHLHQLASSHRTVFFVFYFALFFCFVFVSFIVHFVSLFVYIYIYCYEIKMKKKTENRFINLSLWWGTWVPLYLVLSLFASLYYLRCIDTFHVETFHCFALRT